MASAVLISTGTEQQNAASQLDFAALAFDTILPSSSFVGDNSDQEFPFANTIDYRDNTVYSPNQESGTTVIDFTQPTQSTVDYFAFAIHNSQTSGMTGKFEVFDGLNYITVAEWSSIKDNRPFMFTFDGIASTAQRLTINHTSKTYIGAIQFGKFLRLKCPSVGFQSGRYAPLDTVEQFQTEGSNFIIGRRKKRGFQTKGDFKLLEFIDTKIWYERFQNHVLDSKAMFFKWSKNNDEVAYGQQNYKTMTKLKWITPYHTELSLEINGYS